MGMGAPVGDASVVRFGTLNLTGIASFFQVVEEGDSSE
jgi:hypothetical protein